MGCYTTWWKKTEMGGEPPPPPSKKISFTGHRDIDESSFRTSVANTLSKIKAKYPDAIVNVGGAIGTDMVAGEEALKAGLDIVMDRVEWERLLCLQSGFSQALSRTVQAYLYAHGSPEFVYYKYAQNVN
jgi:hypothetical protein